MNSRPGTTRNEINVNITSLIVQGVKPALDGAITICCLPAAELHEQQPNSLEHVAVMGDMHRIPLEIKKVQPQ